MTPGDDIEPIFRGGGPPGGGWVRAHVWHGGQLYSPEEWDMKTLNDKIDRIEKKLDELLAIHR